MGNRVFILFFVITALSFLYVASVSVFLRVRAAKDMRSGGIIWTAFFAVLTIPLFDVFSIFDLELFLNFTGGFRVEMQNAINGSMLISDLYLPKHFIDTAAVICSILVYTRIISAAGYFTYVFSGYLNNLHFLTKYSEECHDDKIKQIYERARKISGLKLSPSLRVMRKDIRLSPCTCGIIFPSVYVGKKVLYDYSEERLELVFLHELTHIKHGDSLLKLLTLFVISVFSFIPGSKALSDAVSEDAEYRCDTEVIQLTGSAAVGEYMAMIIDIAERNMKNDYSGYDFLSPASRSGEMILERYRKLKKGADRKKNIRFALPVLAAAVFMNVIVMSSFSVTNIDDPGVDFANPLIEKAVCAYFDMDDPGSVSKGMVDSVYSIEFMLSDYSLLIEEAGLSRSEFSAVKLNEGLIFDGEEYSAPVSKNTEILLSCDLIERAIRKNRFLRVHSESDNWNELLADEYIYAENCMILPELEREKAIDYLKQTVGSRESNDHRISKHTVDTRDISLFGGLRTLILSDYLKASDDGIYTSDQYAVIRRGE